MSTRRFKSVYVLITCPLIALSQITETKIIASDGATFDNFGASVSISGEYVVVGAGGDDDNGGAPGSAYVFKREGTSWIQKAKLTVSGGADDYFGTPVSISGDYIVVGGRLGESNSAYVFRREGADWSQEARLTVIGPIDDDFGGSISISGDYLVVGAHRDDDRGTNSGSAYVFRRDGTGWTQEAKITASDGAAYDYFGSSVSISGDYVIVGAHLDDGSGDDFGSAYVFRREGTSWIEEAKISASDGRPNDWFGYSVGISEDRAVVGARYDEAIGHNSGSAYIFEREGTSWTQKVKLTASDGVARDEFGYSVSISGDNCVIGARLVGLEIGAAYIFRREETNWIEEAKITASDGENFDYFGSSVSISGNWVVVGAFGSDDDGFRSGSAYLYTGFSPIVCDDYTSFLARCVSESMVQARLVLRDNLSHSGETVLFQIDSTTYPATIEDNGVSSRASISISGLGSGPHTVSVIDPAGCFEPKVVTCAAGFEKADQEWDADETRWPTERAAVVRVTTRLLGNYPNPFNPMTAISYQLSAESRVVLTVYNTLGEEVATLVNEFQDAGYKSITWNGRNHSGSPVASGIYVYRLTAGSQVQTGRMLLMR